MPSRGLELAEGHMFSSASIQGLLRHLRERKGVLCCVYPAMPFTVVCVSRDGKSIAALRFTLRHGIEDVFHAHDLNDENWVEHFDALRHFIGDLNSVGVYAMRHDMHAAENLIVATYNDDMTEDAIKRRIFSLEELELCILKNIAPQFTERWGDRDCEVHIESGYNECFADWYALRRECCWSMVVNPIQRIWHCVKMVQVSSNILNHLRPGVHMFGLLFEEFPESGLTVVARQSTFLRKLRRSMNE
uniref:DUF2156 domain-containing protein n=1 Tax=Steinernema glaseri TaxID=37863 RepID=A0A1I7ZPQ9_9BILA